MKTQSNLLPPKKEPLPSWTRIHWLVIALLFVALLLLVFGWYDGSIEELDKRLKALPEQKTVAYKTR